MSIPPPLASKVSPNVVANIEDALRSLDEVSTEKELEVSLSGLSRHLGFDYFSYILADTWERGCSRRRWSRRAILNRGAPAARSGATIDSIPS
jgi:hypothetical protein